MAETEFAAGNGEQLLAEIQERAVKAGISDVHLSPESGGVRLEWRLHGVLVPLATLKPDLYVDFLRRVKFLAKLKLNIIDSPQDGQFTFPFESRNINVRVASLPTRFGEAITMRFLDPARGIRPLHELGFPQPMSESLSALMDVPNGLILVTGPTGSGKTTTLYALLSTIIGKDKNIITLEDPIEYEVPGITQSAIDPQHDYTFITALRSVLRQDPDVILVGEIRDVETAQTAVNAALTGHVVLSTLHTNSALEAIPRMLSMGVSPHTFAPALRAVLAQRLVRTLKPECRNKNCDPHAHENYGGQTAVGELLVVSKDMEQLMLAQKEPSAIEAQARKEGFKTMKEWGEELVKNGVTTAEEVKRTIG